MIPTTFGVQHRQRRLQSRTGIKYLRDPQPCTSSMESRSERSASTSQLRSQENNHWLHIICPHFIPETLRLLLLLSLLRHNLHCLAWYDKMAPTTPWGKSKPKQTTQLNNTSFPSLKVPETGKSVPESEYEQVQEDELLVLEAIYGDDFEREDTKPGAWKVR